MSRFAQNHGESPKDPPGMEHAALRRRIAELEEAEVERDHLCRVLTERTKEMQCLYAISRTRNEAGMSTESLLQKIVQFLPPAWQYPEITCARLVLSDGRVFHTRNFKEAPWRQTGDIMRDGVREGYLEVFYLEDRPEMDEGPFLMEERALLEAVCDRVGKILDRAWAEKEARQKDLQLLQLDKMAAVGTLVSGVAHEINNPNNFIMLNAPVLQDAFEDILPILDDYYRENGDFTMGGLPYTEIRDNIAMLFSGILEGAKRIKNIVESLKSFARSDARNLMEPVDVNSVVKTALALVNNQICKATKRFSIHYGKDLPLVKGNFQRLEQVVINLVQNACEALEDNQKAIVLTTSFDPMKRKVLVEVRDEGTGISAECLKKITDPFYTTRRHHGGTGLGLSVSSGIVKDHDGTLTFSSHLGKGTTARLRLPLKNSDPPVPEGEGT